MLDDPRIAPSEDRLSRLLQLVCPICSPVSSNAPSSNPNANVFTRYLLLSAATTMGAVAIWCMHYIGNRAVIMDEGQADLQIQYSPGSTAGSFFLPIFVIAGAFWFFNMSESVNRIKTLIGGFLTGSAVCGMHYMGQGGISNYKCHYIVLYVFGSAIISITATTIALGIFFYFHSTWTDSWWKRAFCASLLAVAVSGMHWTGTAGTMYRKRKNVIQSVSGLSREATVEVVICLVRALGI